MSTVRLKKDTEDRLDHLAKTTNRPKSFYLRELIETGLPRLEYEYGIAQTAADVRAGREKTTPLDEVIRELGLED